MCEPAGGLPLPTAPAHLPPSCGTPLALGSVQTLGLQAPLLCPFLSSQRRRRLGFSTTQMGSETPSLRAGALLVRGSQEEPSQSRAILQAPLPPAELVACPGMTAMCPAGRPPGQQPPVPVTVASECPCTTSSAQRARTGHTQACIQHGLQVSSAGSSGLKQALGRCW